MFRFIPIFTILLPYAPPYISNLPSKIRSKSDFIPKEFSHWNRLPQSSPSTVPPRQKMPKHPARRRRQAEKPRKLLGGGLRLTGKLCFCLSEYHLYFALMFDYFTRNTILNWPLFSFGTSIIPPCSGFGFKICLCLFCISLSDESLCPSTDVSVFPGLPKCVDYNFFLENFQPLIASSIVSSPPAPSVLSSLY